MDAQTKLKEISASTPELAEGLRVKGRQLWACHEGLWEKPELRQKLKAAGFCYTHNDHYMPDGSVGRWWWNPRREKAGAKPANQDAPTASKTCPVAAFPAQAGVNTLPSRYNALAAA